MPIGVSESNCCTADYPVGDRNLITANSEGEQSRKLARQESSKAEGGERRPLYTTVGRAFSFIKKKKRGM
jgi:hypothetical protein